MHKIKTPQMKPTPPHGTTKNTAISIEQCNEQRGLQSAQNLINLEDYYDDDDDLHVLNFLPNDTHFGKRKRPFSVHPMTDNGQSSNSKNNDPSSFLFSIEFCSYSYCTDCIVKYVDSKLRESITSIRCPVTECKGGVLEPEF
ncbi:RING-type domain-containing protein [Citrus sinensis]|nr:RING-type domain-containing protein [Citrus sinensis]